MTQLTEYGYVKFSQTEREKKKCYCLLPGLVPSCSMVVGCQYFYIIIIPPSFTLKMEEVSISKRLAINRHKMSQP